MEKANINVKWTKTNLEPATPGLRLHHSCSHGYSAVILESDLNILVQHLNDRHQHGL
jgi:hypothetical protein